VEKLISEKEKHSYKDEAIYACVIVVCVFALTFYVCTIFLVPAFLEGELLKYWARDDKARTLHYLSLAPIAIIGIGLALWRSILAYRQLQNTQKQFEHLQQENDRNNTRVLEERFQKACEALAHENDAIKLSALTAIEDIVRANVELFGNRSRTILAAMIRNFCEFEKSNHVKYIHSPTGYKPIRNRMIVSCFKTLSVSNFEIIKTSNKIDLEKLDLKYLYFYNINLKNLYLNSLNFSNSEFHDCNIKNSILCYSVFKDHNNGKLFIHNSKINGSLIDNVTTINFFECDISSTFDGLNRKIHNFLHLYNAILNCCYVSENELQIEDVLEWSKKIKPKQN
jgi:uncharacterized protein YjbI with pentapeptide repeats